MNELKSVLKTEFGVCSFDLIKDRLLECRKKADIPENAKSVIVFTFPYKVFEEKPENISRYAAVRDYHPVIESFLKEYAEKLKAVYKENLFNVFVDNSPVPEVYCAAAAGLGVIGENGLLITEKYGSFVFIGEIVTDLYIPCENKVNYCINCGACRKACPVGLNKEKCLSAVTQKKKELTEEEISLIKNNGTVWGCDICAEACPMNKEKELTHIKEFTDSYRNSYSPDEDPTNRPYIWRGKNVIDRNNNIMIK